MHSTNDRIKRATESPFTVKRVGKGPNRKRKIDFCEELGLLLGGGDVHYLFIYLFDLPGQRSQRDRCHTRAQSKTRADISVGAFQTETTSEVHKLRLSGIEIDGPLLNHIPRHMGALLTSATSTPDSLHSGRTLSSHVRALRAPSVAFSGSERTIVEASAVFISTGKRRADGDSRFK